MKNIILAVISIHFIFVNADSLRECRKETGVSWPSLRKLKAGDLTGDDPKLKCYLRCVLVKHAILTKKDEINVEKALRLLPPDMQRQARTSFSKCRNSPAKDKCDKVFQVTKCFFTFETELLKKVSFIWV
ncbi:general odorant-binding protein 69a-like isoform X2 [Belonocnema kinseyi]|uniref:general odorant-binding protein 69a-like isoform X2 n=1 Tax=Belonocnema kinseyi TaxID=2817044 RepID=UPI00143DA8DF|nr:general odorant-binding protein 69a-like isoform X2 [Belonocnema kinseyi]